MIMALFVLSSNQVRRMEEELELRESEDYRMRLCGWIFKVMKK